jgi:hypothetical protein
MTKKCFFYSKIGLEDAKTPTNPLDFRKSLLKTHGLLFLGVGRGVLHQIKIFSEQLLDLS